MRLPWMYSHATTRAGACVYDALILARGNSSSLAVTAASRRLKVSQGVSGRLKASQCVSRRLKASQCVSRRLKASQGVPRRLKVSQGVSGRLKASQCVSRRLNASQGVSRRPKVSQGVSRCPKASQGVSRRLNASQGVSRRLNASQGVSRHLKASQGVSWRLKASQGVPRRPSSVVILMQVIAALPVVRSEGPAWSGTRTSPCLERAFHSSSPLLPPPLALIPCMMGHAIFFFKGPLVTSLNRRICTVYNFSLAETSSVCSFDSAVNKVAEQSGITLSLPHHSSSLKSLSPVLHSQGTEPDYNTLQTCLFIQYSIPPPPLWFYTPFFVM